MIKLKHFPVKTGKLLLAGFITLSLTAIIFLFAINYFDQSNRAIFQHVETSIDDIVQTNELNKMLVALEFDIRELINVILREPHKLGEAKQDLRKRFKLISKKAGEWESDVPRQKLLAQLGSYRKSLDRLLWNYGAINSALYEVYYYINNFNEQFRYMQDSVSQMMVDRALQRKNTDALQQEYVLITLAHENMLQLHILINASISSNNLDLLGLQKKKDVQDNEHTAVDKITYLNSSLRTLTASDERISYYAENILAALPLFRENIQDLSRDILNLEKEFDEFRLQRDKSLYLLDEVNSLNKSRILSIEHTVQSHGTKSRIIAWLISLVVLVVSAFGLIMTTRMGRRIESAAEEAVQARAKAETLNEQLQQEVIERQQVSDDLRRARDELEYRVQERTEQLSSSNRSLALEIKERRNAEYALASEKERLTVTLRSIGDGVITTNIGGSVVLINKVAEQMTGWHQREAYGKPLGEIFQIIHKESGELCENPVESMLRGGRTYNLGDDTVLISRDGNHREISDSCAPIRDKDSTLIGTVLVFRDVTERKRAQQDALKAEKLKSVGILAGGIAHDFNNILAAILGNISFAKLHLEQDSKNKTMQLLDDAEKASLRARNLTQQLLTFSKGGEPIRKVESFGEIIKDSAGFILSGSTVQCQYNIVDDLWPVKIDTGQMSQVIQNLIINALHAMPDGGLIEIDCVNYVHERRLMLPLPEGNYIRIKIKDQGCGIPLNLIDRIFDPYFTTKDEGSGLGLALTHSIINKHQGHIQVDSGGWGTCFSIFLPALPGYTFEPETPRRELPPATERAKILIMDDESMVRDIAGDMLQHLGYEVETAVDGQEALDIYAKNMSGESPVTVVIMDLTIPGGIGGKEAILKLLEIDPAARAIVSSGYSNDPVMSEYRKYGFSGMINKPFQLDELLDAVSRVVGS